MKEIEEIKRKVRRRGEVLKKFGKLTYPDRLMHLMEPHIKNGDYKSFIQLFLEKSRITLKESGEFHFNGARSIPDVYRLVLSYFPEVTLEQVVEVMVDANINRWYCSTPMRVVFGNYGDQVQERFIDDKDASGINIPYIKLCIAYSNRSRWKTERKQYEKA